MEGVSGEVLLALGGSLVAAHVAARFCVHALNRVQSSSAHQPAMRLSGRSDADECPICLCAIAFGCETLCGHAFCTECFLRAWRAQQQTLQPARCPLCRAPVTVLCERFTPTERGPDCSIAAARQRQALRAYNSCVSSTPHRLAQLVREAPALLRRLCAHPAHALRLLRRGRLLLATLATLAYLASPFDLLPEALLGALGLVDDALVLGLVGLSLAAWYRRELLHG